MGIRLTLWNRRFSEEFWRDLNVFVPLYAMVGGMLPAFLSKVSSGGYAMELSYSVVAALALSSIWGDKGLSPRRIHPARQWLYWGSHGGILVGNAVFASWFWTVVSTGGGSWVTAVSGGVLSTVAAISWLSGLWGLWMSSKPAVLAPPETGKK